MRILFIKPSSLGDIVHGLQLAESLRQDFPGISISWVVREMFAPLVSCCDTVDEVLIFNRKGGVSAFLRLCHEVRVKKFDWVIDLQGLFRSGLLTGIARGERKVGRSDAREFSYLFYNERSELPTNGKGAHALDILLQFRRLFGLKPVLRGNLSFESSLPNNFPKDKNLSSPFLFFPESRRAEKQWPFFLELTTALLEAKPESQVVWAGSSKIPVPPKYSSVRFLNLSGMTSLESLPKMLTSAELIVANDSGPMHLAVAMGCPVLAVFGPTDPARFGPYPIPDNTSKVLQAPMGDLSNLRVEQVLECLLNLASSDK